MKFLERFGKDWQVVVIAGAISFAFVGILSAIGDSPKVESTPSMDTYIPAGFILIPIDVQNFEALDSVLGSFGLVDLFRGDGKDGRVIARNIKILRAPQNPSKFAVLVPESQAGPILANSGNFYVAIKPPGTATPQIVNQHHQKREIHFDAE